VTESTTRTEGWPAHRVTGVDVWPYRVLEETPEFLMLHRSGRSVAPFWEGLSTCIVSGEVPHLAALRELREETGLEAVALYAVDAVFDLYAWKRGTVDAIVPFAALVAADSEPQLSDEHDDWRWEPFAEAVQLVPYEPQRAALRRISEDLLERPDLAHLYRIEPPFEGREKSR
jgi:8-oxo-dGTP pyrophosphatase MutT (NUDIX family)